MFWKSPLLANLTKQMCFLLYVKKKRFLSRAALEDGNVVPHFCQAHFAASRADAVPRLQQVSQEMSLTVRLQGMKVSQGC